MSEMCGFILSGFIFELVGTKRSFCFSFSLSFFAGLIIVFYGMENQDSWTFLLQILAAKFGIASAFNIVYVAHNSVFPTMFAASSLGFCNFLARMFTIASPLLAKVD